MPPAEAELTAFYEKRGGRPLWIDGYALRPQARDVLRLVASAEADNLKPEDYGATVLAEVVAAARSVDRSSLAQAELALSRAYARYLVDLKRPMPGAEMIFTDPGLSPRPPTISSALTELSVARSPEAHLTAATRMNPIYQAYRAALAEHRAGRGSQADERLIRANLERARALPPDLGERFVLVDAAAARLWLYEDGKVADSMPVAVGKASQPTPVMAGRIRYAVFNPYWNMPQDLVRENVAGRVLREGTGHLAASDLELLSDWSPAARRLDPVEVDWAAVAAGRQPLRVRQRPGPANMMGSVKLMLPNQLGIYLHDTPHRGVFTAARRAVSAGCVRLEDAPRLVTRLLDGAERPHSDAPEQRVDLPRPVPVYITYFTLGLEGGRLARRPDPYRRDPALLARLDMRTGSAFRPAGMARLAR